MAMIALLAASAALEVGSMIYRLVSRPQANTGSPNMDQISTSANGAPIPWGYGLGRIGGQVIWSSGVKGVLITNFDTPGPEWNYFASFAVAWGEGPACIKRIWGDSKLIYADPSITTNEYPAEAFTAWSSSQLYNPGNIVSYNGQVYECLALNTNLQPNTHPGAWLLISNYPPWSSSTAYNTGDVVTFRGVLLVAQAPNSNVNPLSGQYTSVNGINTLYWLNLNPTPQGGTGTYPIPKIYPGDELQLPDPHIQAAEGIGNTPAFRGLSYCVYANIPLIKFANRIPNLRAEIQFLRVSNVL